MIVLDASAAYLAMLENGDASQHLVEDVVAAPHHIDPELCSALRSRCRDGVISVEFAHAALTTWVGMGIERFPLTALFDRIWELRDNLTPYDAGYVALAEALSCTLVTADGRLARAPGPRCSITVVKS